MKKSGVYAKIINCSLVLFIFITLIIAVVVMFFRMSGTELNIGGVRLFKIVSASMEPKYEVGDYVISIKRPAERLKPGDIIAFISEDEATYGEVIVHRISYFDEDGNFITRGDSNPIDDYSSVRAEMILGKVSFKLTLLKYADKLFSHVGVFIALIVLPLAFIIINEALHLIREEKKHRETTRLIIKYGLDPKDIKLYELAAKFGEEAVSKIALDCSANK